LIEWAAEFSAARLTRRNSWTSRSPSEEHAMTDKSSTAAELIRWANEQRAAYRRGELNRVRIRKLESIPGWQWEPD